MYVRTGSVVENQKQVEKKFPHMTKEYFIEGLLELWTTQDILCFELNEEKFGTDVAVNMYCELWERRCTPEFYHLKTEIGLEKDDPVTMDQFMDMIEIYYNGLGNPLVVTHREPDYYEASCYDCPYTTQFAWKLYDKKRVDHFMDSTQVDCNKTLFETFLKLAGLYDDWLFTFGSAICRYGGKCNFQFRKKIKEPEWPKLAEE